jgi:hypothetical protein
VTAPLYELPGNDIARVHAIDVLEHLNSLGKTPYIAQRLARFGILGRRFSDIECPLSIYLVAVLPEVQCAAVSMAWVSLYSDDRRKAQWRVPVSLRDYPLIRNFIKEVDRGHFPGLLHNPSPACYT